MAHRIDSSRWGGRLRLGLAVAAAVFLVDHVTKLLAVGLAGSNVVRKPGDGVIPWLALVIFLVGTLIRSRAVAIAVGLLLGSASNAVDLWLWPGGVPKPIGGNGSYANLADLFVIGGLLGAAVFGLISAGRFAVRRRAAAG